MGQYLNKADLDDLWLKIKTEFTHSLSVTTVENSPVLQLKRFKYDGSTTTGFVLNNISQVDGRTWLGTGTMAYENLDNGKIPLSLLPDVILGQVVYGGTVNASGVATLTPNAKTKTGITSATAQLLNEAGTASTNGWVRFNGIYFIMSEDSTFASLGLQVGDWLISTGTAWKKIDNTDAVTGVKGDNEQNYRIGNVNITKDNIGLGSVGNFLAVSTAASQGLTDTQKSNARDNIGLGSAATHSHDTYLTAVGIDATNGKLTFSLGDTPQTAIPIVATKLTTTSKTMFGNEYWTSTGVPTSIGYDVSHRAALQFVSTIDAAGYVEITAAGANFYGFRVKRDTTGTYAYGSSNIGGVDSNGTYFSHSLSGQTDAEMHLKAGVGLSINQNLLVTGKVGIGKTSPECKLDVVGDIYATGGVSANGIINLGLSGGGSGTLTRIQINGVEVPEEAGIVNITATTGDSTSGNGTIKIAGQGISVYGLQSAAFVDASAFALASHVHGNITNDGKISSDTSVANNFKIVATDTNGNLVRTGITFDGSTTTKALSKAGTWVDVNNYSLPVAKFNTLGGLKPAYTSTNAATLTGAAASNTSTPTINGRSTTEGRYYAIEADKNGIPFVNVPWTDASVTSSSNHYSPSSEAYSPTAGTWTWGTTSVVTGITKDGKGHIVGVTTTSISNPNSNTWRGIYSGGTSRVGTGTDTKAMNFAVAGALSVDYLAAGTGTGQSGNTNYFTIKITHSTSGATAGSYGNSTAQTPAFGGTFNVPYITVNDQGHITAISDKSVTIPSATATQSAAGLMAAIDKKYVDWTRLNVALDQTTAEVDSFTLSAPGTQDAGTTVAQRTVTVGRIGTTYINSLT